jgi:hypothetical protein
MGNKELSWDMVGNAFRKVKGMGKVKAAGRE